MTGFKLLLEMGFIMKENHYVVSFFNTPCFLTRHPHNPASSEISEQPTC